MATQRVNDPKATRTRRAPARTPEDRENQMIALAVDQAEKLMESGNAPAQIITHYLKLGSSSEKLAQQYKEEEIKLLRIKADAYASQKRVEELYSEAMHAFRAYSGQPAQQEEEDPYEA